MREIYPSHYAAFHCIAGACPDSCCKEWEIVVDTASAERYRSVSGTLGERLRQAMITDADGDIVFQEHNSRCPFWNAQQLCDIHGELGEDALCETCRLFPRITQDYGDFIEFDISPACPEAARLLFSMTPKQWQLTERSSPAMTEEPPEYAVILLLTNNIGGLLPTIQSRCVRLDLKVVDDGLVKKYLMEHLHVPDYQAEIDASFAQGSIGRAKEAATSQEFAEMTQNALRILKYANTMEVYELSDAIKSLSEDKQNINDYLDIFQFWFRDVLMFKATQEIDNLVFKQEINFIREQAKQRSYENLENILDSIQKTKVRLKANVNFDLAFELLFLTIREK